MLAIYPAPFWRARGLSGEVVSTGGFPFSVVFDNSPAGEGGAPRSRATGHPSLTRTKPASARMLWKLLALISPRLSLTPKQSSMNCTV